MKTFAAQQTELPIATSPLTSDLVCILVPLRIVIEEPGWVCI